MFHFPRNHVLNLLTSAAKCPPGFAIATTVPNNFSDFSLLQPNAACVISFPTRNTVEWLRCLRASPQFKVGKGLLLVSLRLGFTGGSAGNTPAQTEVERSCRSRLSLAQPVSYYHLFITLTLIAIGLSGQSVTINQFEYGIARSRLAESSQLG